MNYKVGDKVIIRKWDEMARAYGTDRDGDIKTNIRFVTRMREFCGQEMKIEFIIESENGLMYLMKGGRGFAFSEDVFERVAGEAKAEPKKEPKSVETKFKVGDRVRLTKYEVFGFDVGETGTIIEDDGSGIPYKISRDGDGLEIWTRPKNLELVNEEPSAEPAKTEPKSQYFNGKVKCIRSDYDWWTVGKVYEVVDGIITADNGYEYPKMYGYRYKDAEDIRHAGCTGGKNYNEKNEFIPVEEEPKPKFIPHLLSSKDHCGVIGEPTNYKDKNGEPLYIGDVVEHIDDCGESHGDTVIVKTKLLYKGGKEKVFVMGIESSCDDKEGTTGDWTIVKKRSFEDVANGEKVFGIKYVKEAD